MPTGLEGQSISLVSLPLQDTLSRRMDPVPRPKNARKIAVAPVIKGRINCMHADSNYCYL